MSATGRPRALDAAKSAELCSLVASGVTVEQAARHVGCCLQTVRRQARRDPEFKRQLKSARAAAPVEPLRLVRRAAGSHWRAAAWLLERTEPERYAARPATSCRPEQVEDLVARLLEAALDALSCDEKQRFRVYKRVDQTAQEGLSRLFPAGRKPRSSSVFTPHTHHMRLCEEFQLLRDDDEDGEDDEDEEDEEQGHARRNDPPAPAQPKTQPLSASVDQAAD